VQLPPGLDPRGLRAAFLDLDGTILHQAVPVPTARGAIERLQATGVQCVIATGRMLTSARPSICLSRSRIGRRNDSYFCGSRRSSIERTTTASTPGSPTHCGVINLGKFKPT